MTSLSDLCLFGSLFRHGSAHWTALGQESCLRASLHLPCRVLGSQTKPYQLHLQFSNGVSSTLLKTDLSVSIYHTCLHLPGAEAAASSHQSFIPVPKAASMTGHHTFVLPDLSFPVPVSSSKGLLHLDPRLQSVLYHSCSPSFSSKQPTDEPLRGLAYTWGTTYHCLGKGHRPSPAKKDSALTYPTLNVFISACTPYTHLPRELSNPCWNESIGALS